MKITLRRKGIKNGQDSLYLDCYIPKAAKPRFKEYLKMYVFQKPKNALEKDHNKRIIALAESIRSKRLLELQHQVHEFGHLLDEKTDYNFIQYFSEQTDKRYQSQGNYGNWDSVLKHLIKYKGEHVSFKEIDNLWLEGFKDYLKNTARTKSNTLLSQNSCYSYFNKVRACLKQAVRDRIISVNPSEFVKGFKQGETEREFLTLDELKAVWDAKCDNEMLKRAFLFGCLTGMRWSDINKMTWEEVQHSKEQGWSVRFIQRKTKGVENHPVSEQAIDLLGERKESTERVFKGLKYSTQNNIKLQLWMMRGGITKTITFHCSRHTYATLQLSLGTDIFTVSKLLGHKELRTTMVYAKIIDQKKVEAANIIPKI